jgi:hypothetical protein
MDRFKVGDLVWWCGVPGRVTHDHKFPSELAASLRVEFEVYAPNSVTASKQSETFMYDGRLHNWHKEPSLKSRIEEGK